MATAAFIVLGLMAVAGALGVVLQRNALYGALSLVGTFLATAGLYLLLHSPFLAVLQVIVYAGAIMVLFVFVIMLLSLNYQESGEAQGIPAGWRRILAFVLGGVLLAQLAFMAGSMVLTGTRGTAGDDFGSARQVGEALYTRYVYPFEVASVLLLVAIVGAVAITRRHGHGLEGRVDTGEGA